MPLIELRFPAGRYHATPWGSHVNEGAVEWPPSPWRLLRALIATWHLKVSPDEAPEPLMRQLIQALAQEPPACQLPPASLGHTRHYLPLIESGKQNLAKVFDTFIHVAGPLRIKWEAALSSEQRRVLALLCERLGYLGRAEALVEARLLADDAAFAANARPLPENEPLPRAHELVRVLAPQCAEAFQRWRDGLAAASPPPAAAPRARARKAARASAGPKLPADLFDALHADTGDLQAAGWPLPPGARLADYVRREDCFESAPIPPPPRPGRPVTVARFVVASTVAPRLTRAVSVAERIHQALIARFRNEPAPSVFTGLDPGGKPLKGHGHSFIFCEAAGPRDAITHVTLFAREGFAPPARRALESLQRVWGHGGHDLQLVLLGFGDPRTFSDCRLFAAAKVWRSLTPFVATRHPKTHRDGRPKLDADGWPIGSPAHDLRRLLAEASLPLPAKIEPLATLPAGTRRLRPLQFQSQRYHGQGRCGRHSGTAFQLTFAEPVSGPLAFGYGAHFGLGLFAPVDE